MSGMGEPDEDPAGSIRRATWMVRHYERALGDRQRTLRAQAILLLGLTVRDAFNKSSDFETLLTALVDGLRPRDRPPF